MAVGGGGCGGCRRSYGRGWAVEAVEVVGIMAVGWTGVGGVMAVGGGGCGGWRSYGSGGCRRSYDSGGC